MKPFRNTMVALFSAGIMLSSAGFAGDLDRKEDPVQAERTVIRVLYLKGMPARDAVTMLRMNVQLRQIATIRDRDLVIVADTLDRVEGSENLLRQEGAVSRVVEPHPPLDFNASAGALPETRTFQVGVGESGSAVTILRAIYQMRNVTETAENNSIEVREVAPVLDASEALLLELGLLIVSE